MGKDENNMQEENFIPEQLCLHVFKQLKLSETGKNSNEI